jgi:diadenosine tetraphosphate (Ap4A) HIT family hydrolase
MPRFDTLPILLYRISRILLKTEEAIAFADASPISAGHTIVAPRQHVGSNTAFYRRAERLCGDLLAAFVSGC